MKKKILSLIEKYPYILIAMLGFIVYAQTIGFDLSYCDDHDIILTFFDRIKSLSNLTTEFFRGYIGTDYYRPMINFSFILDAQIAGQNIWIYHLSNIVFHILASISVFYLLRKFANFNLALMLSLLFVVHPISVNAVAWIVGRNDTIMTLFAVLAFLFSINYFEKKEIKDLILFSVFLFGSILSKESGFFILPIIFYYFYFYQKINFKDKSFINLSIASIFPVFLWFIFRSNSNLGQSINKSSIEIFFFNLRVIPEFIGKFFLPINQSVLPAYNLMNTTVGLIVMLILGIVIFYQFKKKQINLNNIIFGFVWFIMPLIPVLFISIINVDDWNEYLECRAYLPIIGLLIILSELLKSFFVKYELRNYLIVYVIILVFGLVAFNESKNYQNAITYFESAIKDAPQKPLYHFVLSRRYRDTKQYAKEENSIRNAMQLRETYAKYPYNLGVFFYNHDKVDSSLQYLNYSIMLDSNYFDSYKAIGSILFSQKNYSKALAIWEISQSKFPENQEFKLNILTAEFMLKNYSRVDSLVRYFHTNNLFQQELYGFFLSTGDKLSEEKEYEQSLEAFNYCLNIYPNFLDSYMRLFNYYLDIAPDFKLANYYYEILRKSNTNIPQSSLEKLEKLSSRNKK